MVSIRLQFVLSATEMLIRICNQGPIVHHGNDPILWVALLKNSTEEDAGSSVDLLADCPGFESMNLKPADKRQYAMMTHKFKESCLDAEGGSKWVQRSPKARQPLFRQECENSPTLADLPAEFELPPPLTRIFQRTEPLETSEQAAIEFR